MVGVFHVQLFLAKVASILFGQRFATVPDLVRQSLENVSARRGKIYNSIGIHYRTFVSDKRYRGKVHSQSPRVIERERGAVIVFIFPRSNKKLLQSRIVGLSFATRT